MGLAWRPSAVAAGSWTLWTQSRAGWEDPRGRLGLTPNGVFAFRVFGDRHKSDSTISTTQPGDWEEAKGVAVALARLRGVV